MRDTKVGTITRVDRANAVAYARFDDYGPGEESPHAYMQEPLPLTPAAFAPPRRGGDERVCVGTLGRPDRIISDHFLYGANGTIYGDRGWVADGGAGTVSGVGGLANGVIRIAPNAGNAMWLRRDRESLLLPTDQGALHMHARVRSNISGTAENPDAISIGFTAFSLFGQCVLTAFGNLNEWRLSVIDLLGVSQQPVEGSAFVIDQWFHLDIVLASDVACGAVDGNPFTAVNFSLDPGASFESRMYVQDTSGGTNRLDVDVATVNFIHAPSINIGRTDRSQGTDVT